MKKFKGLFAVALAILLVMSFSFSSELPNAVAKSSTQKISKEFSDKQLTTNGMVNTIVELRDDPVIPFEIKNRQNALQSIGRGESAESYARQLTEKQLNVYYKIAKLAPEAKIGYRYQYTYNGFALTLKGGNIEKIVSLKEIKKVFPVRTYHISGDLSDSIIGAPDVWKMKDAKGNPIDGKGMLIGIIDTGIDYNDPDLGGGFGPGYKVVGGYDFGDNDPDPMDMEGHGTHVAGITAANGKIKGVAPEAHLMAYKIVPGGQDSASDSAIIAAVERAVKDKCDSVNLSFGSGSLGTADPDDPENKAFDNAADAGVLAAVAAGNQGARCETTPYPLGSPAGAPKVIAVAASDDGLHPAISIVSPASLPKDMALILGNYADLSPDFPADEEFSVVPCGYGRKSDFVNVDVKGKIALVSRGPVGANAIYFRDKDLNAEAAGAAGIIIYNNLPGIVSPTFQVTEEDANKKYIPAIFVTQDKGLLIKSLLGQGLKIKFNAVSALGTIASFSSMGPTSDFFFKPEVSAPGVAVNSTILDGKYARWDGTSMATPHVTGAIALIKQAHPDWTSEQIKAAIMNTATILKNYQNNHIITWTLQGSGRLNIPAAINTPAVATPYDVLMKVGEAHPITFTVSNLTNSPVSFDVSTAFITTDTSGITPPKEGRVIVPGKSSKDITLKFEFDSSKISSGPHEGVVYFKSSKETLHVPFIFWEGNVEIPKKLSNVSASSDTISPGSDKNGTMEFKFALGSGSLIPPAERKDRPTNSNIIDEMQIRIEDMKGNELGIIYQQSLLLLGTYTFMWDGRDIYGNYFLKDGTYKWAVAAVESNNDENKPKVEDAAKVEGTFKVENAPSTFISFEAEKNTIAQADHVSASINLSAEKSVSEIRAVVAYNPNVISVEKVDPGDLISNLGEDANLKATIDNVIGEITIELTTKNGKTITGKGNLVKLDIEGKLFGNTDIGFRSSEVLDSNSKEIACVFTPGFLTVEKAKNPWDLNRDNKVDDNDLTVFMGTFGSEAKDPNYLPLADFNYDGVIDGKDLIILAQHMGETYP